MQLIRSFVAFLGRALLSIIFISAAINKMMDWQGTMQGFVQVLCDSLTFHMGNIMLQDFLNFVFANANLLLIIATIFEFLGGLCVFFGLWTRVGALMLLLVIIPATFFFHHFWQLEGLDRQMQMTHFMKNLSIMGGLLFLIAVGSGRKISINHD